MHDMIRGMTYDPQDLEAYPPVASRVVAHMLRVAPSCAVSAALVHMAHRQQVHAPALRPPARRVVLPVICCFVPQGLCSGPVYWRRLLGSLRRMRRWHR